MNRFVVNFHGIGAPRRKLERGEAGVWIGIEQFEKLADLIQAGAHGDAVDVTFDDGNVSDWEIAAPRLAERNLHATFFILPGRLGSPGYLSQAQVRDLANRGFAIGSHGLNHCDWRRIGANELQMEVSQSRSELEQLLKRPVTAVAIPFGAYDRRVLRAIRSAGYERVYSSSDGPRLTRAWPQPRFSVRCDTTPADLQGRINRGRSCLSRAKTEIKTIIKATRPSP